MRIVVALVLLILAGTAGVLSQSPAPSVPEGPTFEVVSIKRSAAAQSADPSVRLSSSQNQTGPRMEGDMTMASLANFLRPGAGRWVIDKTGLAGSYRVVLEYDRMASLRGPETAPTPGSPPSAFTAVQEQLWMKLESARGERERLVVDRIERPTEN